jgi:O-antigen/teichoic acid export membrane protein
MEQRRLLRDSLFNVSARVLAAGFGLIAVPLFVSRLPTHDYADWIIMLATCKSAVVVDFGVGWTIVHLLAAEGRTVGAEARRHLRAAATLLSTLGIVAALVTFTAGWLQLGDLHGHRLTIFAAGAVMAAMTHINSYSMGVLWGRRRFDLGGMLVAAEAGIQSCGVVVILFWGGDIAAVALWEASTVTAAALAKLVVAWRVCPDAAYRPALRWPTAPLRLVRFGLASQVSDGFASLFWTLGVLILGQVAGAAAVVGLNVGQKVPVALAGFVTRAAEVTMPAASGLDGTRSEVHATVAVTSARIAVGLCVPAVVTIWFIAEPFLSLWVGGDVTTLVPIMRIAAVTVAAHALGESARHFLWGSERVGTNIAIQFAGIAILAFGAGFLYALAQISALSFAALQGITVGAMSVALATATAERVGLSGRAYITRVARGIALAAVAAAAVGTGLTMLWPVVSWPALATVAACVTATFGAVMIGFGLDGEESVALRRLLRPS